MNEHKFVAFIPVRSGSKGVVGKNIKLLCGKPLVAWSIEQARACSFISDVYVSTDSEEIKEIAEKYGAKCPFLRPLDISDDTATTESSVMHFIGWANKNDLIFDSIVLMQATSPLRYKTSLSKAINIFKMKEADSLVTVVESHKFMWKCKSDPVASYNVNARPRRQDIIEDDITYFENGSFYITKRKVYEEIGNRIGGKVVLFSMTPEESHEIDEEVDFIVNGSLLKYFGFIE